MKTNIAFINSVLIGFMSAYNIFLLHYTWLSSIFEEKKCFILSVSLYWQFFYISIADGSMSQMYYFLLLIPHQKFRPLAKEPFYRQGNNVLYYSSREDLFNQKVLVWKYMLWVLVRSKVLLMSMHNMCFLYNIPQLILHQKCRPLAKEPFYRQGNKMLYLIIASDKAFFLSQRELTFFLFLYENLCCVYSFEAPHCSASVEYLPHMFLWRNIIWMPSHLELCLLFKCRF